MAGGGGGWWVWFLVGFFFSGGVGGFFSLKFSQNRCPLSGISSAPSIPSWHILPLLCFSVGPRSGFNAVCPQSKQEHIVVCSVTSGLLIRGC